MNTILVSIFFLEIECTPNVGAINAVSDCKGFTPNEACTYSCTDGWSETGGNENVQVSFMVKMCCKTI